MNTQEKIKMMQAWVDGKTIQVRGLYDKHDCSWRDVKCEPVWCWDSHTYRIKPETVAYRRYLYKTPSGVFVGITNHTYNNPEQIEKGFGFVRWLDHDWVYIEV